MSRTRMAIVGFWIVIISLLLWECSNYNRGLTQAAVDHPPQQHFFFYKTNTAPVAVVAPVREGAQVEQTGFDVLQNSPGPGSFTCRVTVRNVGNAKATAVQVDVRPYKGIALGDVDEGGHHKPGNLSDSDPTSMIGHWVTFPDLAPGESATASALFIMRRDVDPGTNPEPEIIFESEKPKNAAAPPPAAPMSIPVHHAAPD